MMNCNEAVEYIHSLEKFGMKPGLERIKALCEILGNPQKELEFVHVAGTNGKGSTSTMVANILTDAGYKTGLFTSPYVTDFRERIQIDGNMIGQDELAHTVEEVKKAVDTLNDSGIEPTEFEVITAAAFVYFRNMRCDAVVLEVGLGGRLDSTNVIDCPLVNVITSISMDHVAVLGDTLTKIAGEKCGTLKENGTCVCYPEQSSEAMKVIEEKCREKRNRLVLPSLNDLKDVSIAVEGSRFTYNGVRFAMPLTGLHIVKNAVTAIEAVRVISQKGFFISDDNIKSGLSVTVMPARLEVLCKNPLVILDGGHNEGCAFAVADFISSYLKDYKITAVISMMADKDYESYLRITSPYFSRIIASYTNVPRALTAEKLCETASMYCKNCTAADDVCASFDDIFAGADKTDAFIFCGSFYFAGEIRNKLKEYLRCSYD